MLDHCSIKPSHQLLVRVSHESPLTAPTFFATMRDLSTASRRICSVLLRSLPVMPLSSYTKHPSASQARMVTGAYFFLNTNLGVHPGRLLAELPAGCSFVVAVELVDPETAAVSVPGLATAASRGTRGAGAHLAP